ncbi:diaminopropionate ammonia-lyase [Blastomyces gilchristii SLH14081]|uniref:Diaminopropionate ammonia-lyase n=1 Tax=Blastomyces gilchristii (strain SLH14081) TaxID=559298 RepID=A0A179UWA7_BLAGS|nr:diaminopropionate ammonia-lyase [Blastomyces gilchristii SLH14081]OAT12334.1 diaminopropionate ammonia-lyase [Blastomyces gilchristii SLH14081]
MSTHRRQIYFNPTVEQTSGNTPSNNALKFHQSLPHYSRTPLVPLNDLARELGITGIYVKDESDRLCLPSFKILGASWGTFRAIVAKTNVSPETSLADLSDTAREQSITLYAATDGNHGRAVAFMAKLLRIQARIYVPALLDEATKSLISNEGAKVISVSGTYDKAVRLASEAASSVSGGLLIQDTAFDGYEEIPPWIIEGYYTMLHEIDSQLGEKNVKPTMVVTPVGVGSLAEAVVSHFKSPGHQSTVMVVEPDTAACLHKSLRLGKCVPLDTSRTIMNGLDCGTVSSTAWPILQAGVDVSVTISDFEAHQAVRYLESQNIRAGPCGAAGIAALRRLGSVRPLDPSTVAVLLCTEGSRPYSTPFDVSVEDPIALSELLHEIQSPSPSSSQAPEREKAKLEDYIAAWLEHRDLDIRQLHNITSLGLGSDKLASIATSMVSLLRPKALDTFPPASTDRQ